MMNWRPWGISGAVAGVTALVAGALFLPVHAQQNGSPQSGIVEQQEVDLSFKIAGRIESLSVSEGQSVKKGQVLGRLEHADLQAKVEQAQAAMDAAAANVQKAEAAVGETDQTTRAKVSEAQAAVKVAQDQLAALQQGSRPQEIAQAQAKVDGAQAAYHQAQDAYDKALKLYQSGAVSEAEKNQAELQLSQAKAEYEAAQNQLQLAQAGPRPEQVDAARHQVEQAQGALQEARAGRDQVAVAQADVKAAQAQLEQAKAGLDEAQTYLSYTELVAPVDGIVVKKNFSVGEMVNAGDPVLTVADPADKWVSIYVGENQLPQVKVGDPVSLDIPALHRQVNGRVEEINPAPQFAVTKATNHLQDRDIQSFQVKIKIEDNPRDVLAGLTAVWQGAKTP
ncbi:Multidrug transporter [Kyrpidia spormannii]|uniref:Multidrug transporter n=1 Tax=Kyrpidia spormannii TaxID=2055160 RepID=A0ACA8Z6I0_9BACL|nr:Multidrug transporter [Kyrpidia spormannii]